MGIADLGNVLKIFGGSEVSAEAQRELFHEVLLMVLARASSSDSSIQGIEVKTIQDIIKRETGNAISEQDVRRAARTELYETTPLDKYLASASGKLSNQDRVAVVSLLADVIRSDTEVSVLEIDFFNMVAGALKATAAEIAGLYNTR
jgi:uncharacterized tellurite resistance protein B-like protein